MEAVGSGKKFLVYQETYYKCRRGMEQEREKLEREEARAHLYE
jgi:hypothetical protein